ncbi:hypothetical protein [Natribacillus halophilus]|uniref:Uncharacterized protein n=1 Tax=Natribacillus halophilus TaxID=549003 RepID=A0A1G8LBB6_9BACI|nr:hypothetical protein [Natribacillus halophilus]SDI52984.1 hypothetical protein SAMN04488123_1038 [Natribacillus halophilus]
MTVYEALMLCTAISTLVYFIAKKRTMKKSDTPEQDKLEGVVTFPGELHFK